MTTFDDHFSTVRALLHSDTIEIAAHLHHQLTLAHQKDPQRCLEVLCPYVEDILQQRMTDRVSVQAHEMLEHAKHIPSLYIVEHVEQQDLSTQQQLRKHSHKSTVNSDLVSDQYSIQSLSKHALYDRIMELSLFIDHTKIAALEPMPHLSKICFFRGLNHTNLDALNDSWILDNITRLHFCIDKQSDAIFPQLNIDWLNVNTLGHHDGITENGIATLLRSGQLENIYYISLNHLSDETTSALSETRLPRLQTYWLNHSSCTDENAIALLSNTKKPQLRRFLCNRTKLTNDFCKQLKHQPTHPNLKLLDLGSNTINTNGIRHLAKWPGLSTVETLGLNELSISARGLQHLLDSPYATTLRYLCLNQQTTAHKNILSHTAHITLIDNVYIDTACYEN